MLEGSSLWVKPFKLTEISYVFPSPQFYSVDEYHFNLILTSVATEILIV
jgi:hypothetical protein